MERFRQNWDRNDAILKERFYSCNTNEPFKIEVKNEPINLRKSDTTEEQIVTVKSENICEIVNNSAEETIFNDSNVKSEKSIKIEGFGRCENSDEERSIKSKTLRSDADYSCNKQQLSDESMDRIVFKLDEKNASFPERTQLQLPCDVCKMCFESMTSLDQHLLSHNNGQQVVVTSRKQPDMGERLFVCVTCGADFKDEVNLKKHHVTYSDHRPFVCQTCGVRFMSKSNLMKHKLIHSGERPFECDICGKKFTQKSNLIVHIRVHTGERPYQCVKCVKRFTTSSNLVQHMRGRHRCKTSYRSQIKSNQVLIISLDHTYAQYMT